MPTAVQMRLRMLPVLLWMTLLFAGCASTELPTVDPSEIPNEAPFQGTNVLYIATDDDVATARERLASVLQTQGYTISQEEEPGIVATEPRTYGGGSARFYAAFDEDGFEDEGPLRVRLTGRWIPYQVSDRHGFAHHQPYRVEPVGERLATVRLSWQALESIAESYPGGDVRYGRAN